MLTMPCISARSVEYSPPAGNWGKPRFRVPRHAEDRGVPSAPERTRPTTTRVQIPVTHRALETSHPGNIGASARAMKTMGSTSSCSCVRAPLSERGGDRARGGADDILATARRRRRRRSGRSRIAAGWSARARGSHRRGARGEPARVRRLDLERLPAIASRSCSATSSRVSRTRILRAAGSS